MKEPQADSTPDFVPVIIESLQSRQQRADLPEPRPRAWDRVKDENAEPTAYGLRIAWRLVQRAKAQRNSRLFAEYMAEFVAQLGEFLNA